MLTFAGILWRVMSEVLVSKVNFYICFFTLFAVFNICSSINLPCPLPLVGLQMSKCQLSPHQHFAVPLCLHPVFTSLTSVFASQTSSLLRSWWRSVDQQDLWWLALWPPSVSWQQPSCSVRWLPASSTSSAGGSSRGKEVMGQFWSLVAPQSLGQFSRKRILVCCRALTGTSGF